MALRASELIAHFEHALGNAPIDTFATLPLVNQAGAWLLSAHPWKFLARPPYRLNLRGTITITAATWTEVSRRLTVTSPASAFANYTWLEGDEVEITGGTGANPGFYRVQSKFTSTIIVLESSLGASATTGITGELALPSARLPDDIQELLAVQCCGISGSNVELMTMDALTQVMADNTASVDTDFYGALCWSDSSAVLGGAPIPRLQIWPAPSVDANFSILVHYRAGWVRMTADDQISPTPDWFDSLLIQAVKSYARGLDKHTMDEELARVQTSAMFIDAQRRDGQFQRKLGRYRGGAVSSRMRYGDPHVGNWDIRLP